MEVKIYREPENESLILSEENLQEYNTLVSELGLSFGKKDADIPNIYVCLNIAMKKQLKALCPTIVEVEKYDRTTIPVDVLKVLKFCKENSMFEGFQIWYDDIAPDPLLIGWKWQDENAKAKNYTWQKNHYLIARWGDCAKELDELCQLGFKRIEKMLQEKAIVAIEKCNSVLKNTEVYVNKVLQNNSSDMSIDLNTDTSFF